MEQQEIIVLTKNQLTTLHESIQTLEKKLDALLEKDALPTKWLRTYQVQKYFGISRSVLDRLIAEGKIKAYRLVGKPSGDRFFKLDELAQVEDAIFV